MVDKMRIKQHLESPIRLNEQRGMLGVQYVESPLHQCAKQAIASALFKYH